jgi:hypothetical protein
MDKKSNSKKTKNNFKILTNVNDSRYEAEFFDDNSVLEDYNRISNLRKNNKDRKKNIFLDHPKLNQLKISNKQEWDFLYQNNIINECIEDRIVNAEQNIKTSLIKIHYINQNSKQEEAKYADIMAHIMNNISPDEYVTHLLNFLRNRKDIINEFKLYLTKILLDLNIKQEINKIEENEIKEEKVKNKYIIETNKFFNILEIKLNEIKNSYQSNNINKSINKFGINNNDEQINHEAEDKEDNSLKSIFNFYESNLNLYKINTDNQNIFGTQSKEEYYEGIKGFKSQLSMVINDYLISTK